jgi:hypothetical protein
VLDARPRVPQQRSRQPQVLGAGKQVPLEDGVPRRSRYGRLEQVGIAVAEAVDAEARREIEDGEAIGQAPLRTRGASSGLWSGLRLAFGIGPCVSAPGVRGLRSSSPLRGTTR